MLNLNALLIGVVLFALAKFVSYKKFSPITSFLLGAGVSLLMGLLILTGPEGSIDNWSSFGLVMLLGAFPLFIGMVMAVGSQVERDD